MKVAGASTKKKKKNCNYVSKNNGKLAVSFTYVI